jgi:hypothetical protein
MTSVRYAHETPLELVEAVLRDNIDMDRWQRAGTLTQAECDLLTLRSRERLQLLRSILAGEGEEPVELTDAGVAVLTALKIGQNPAAQELIRRAPGLMTAQMLANHPGVTRGRRYDNFVAIDGDRA